MNQIDLTIKQTLKILWSFLWRGWLLMMPIMVLMLVAMRFMIPFPKPGEPPMPPDLKQMQFLFFGWLVMMGLWVVSQGFALRWALKTKWSDFRIVAVATALVADEPKVK